MSDKIIKDIFVRCAQFENSEAVVDECFTCVAGENYSKDIAYLISENEILAKEVKSLEESCETRDMMLRDLYSELELYKERESMYCPNDYICSIRHYDKYGSRYTFAFPSQWYELEFSDHEDYQEFQMQLVYILGEARKKWQDKSNNENSNKTAKIK